MKFAPLFLAAFLLTFTQISYAEDTDLPLTKSEQKSFTPEQVLEELLST